MGIHHVFVYRLLSKMIKPSIRRTAMEEFQTRYDEIAVAHTGFFATLWLWREIFFLSLQRMLEHASSIAAAVTESLVMTLRRFKKERTFMLINGFGLAAGLFCTLIILAFVRHEIKYDQFHEKADRIYRITLDAFFAGENIQAPHSSAPLAPALKEVSPDVAAFARLYPFDSAVISTESEQFNREKVFYADPSIFDVFTFPFIQQGSAAALNVPNTVVITERAALRYFATTDAIGKTLQLGDGLQMTVSDVIANVPRASHVHFDVLCAMATLRQRAGERLERWLPFNFYSYILTREQADLSKIEACMAKVNQIHLGGILESVGGTVKLQLQPLKSIHLHSSLAGEIEVNGNAQVLLILAGIGLFVLVVAGLNTVNLMTARRLVLVKEMTIRQTLGAGRSRLIWQMMLETLWTTLSATVLAWMLILLFSGAIKDYLGFRFSIEPTDLTWLISATLGIVLSFSVFAGFYPAFSLLRRQELVVNRFNQVRSRHAGGRHWLVLLQFAISIVLIIASGVIERQLHFFSQKDLGFQMSHRIVLDLDNSQIGRQLKTAFATHPGILNVGSSSVLPGYDFFKQPILPEGCTEDERINMKECTVDPDYFPALGIPMTAGRNFDWSIASDRRDAVIINQSAAEVLGWKNPVGKTLSLDPRKNDKKVIIGVVRDFHFESLHHAVAPLFVTCSFAQQGHMVVHLKETHWLTTLEHIEKAWGTIMQGQPFHFKYLDQVFDVRYQQEQRLIRLIRLFTGLALLIAALGLWGMAIHTTERRTKEIGIRRTLGASVCSIGWQLSNQMLKWILLANVIAWPVAYWITQWWLEQFAFHQWPSIWMFGGAALFVLLIAILAIGWQTWRAARANPVVALRYE